ncbi:MAG TPA: DUF4404 family protein [Pirellulaceae bacterium]|nr:DUF4404 family protein [Pirellulaceae bacterium]
MTETAQKLRATLSELEAELRNVDQLDPESRAVLETALEEIQSALHSNTAPGSIEPHSLGERLQISATEFETSHPALAGLLHRLVDALTQLGI